MNQAVNSATPEEEGPTLADLREAAGLSGRAAAAALGVTQPRIVQIERDGVDDPIDKIANAYGINPEVVREANRRVRKR